jgi:hypothetical protein
MAGNHTYNAKEWSDRLLVARTTVMEYYGGLKCALCEETRFGALNIDHVVGGGARHRIESGMRNSQAFYRWLNREKPSGYRVLCANDNWLEHLRLLPVPSNGAQAD